MALINSAHKPSFLIQICISISVLTYFSQQLLIVNLVFYKTQQSSPRFWTWISIEFQVWNPNKYSSSEQKKPWKWEGEFHVYFNRPSARKYTERKIYLLKSIHFKKTVTQTLFLSIVLSFLLKSKQSQRTWQHFWKKWGLRNCLLKRNGLYDLLHRLQK